MSVVFSFNLDTVTMVTKNGVIVFFVYFCFPRLQRPVSGKMKVKSLHLVTGDKTMASKEVYYYYHLKSCEI